MSHAATNWAIAQRGLKPATKIVLWHLADCHNPSYGCFPSQDYLSDRCEMSRSSLNEHLATLENAGLIRRESRRCSRTKKQENTRYHLAFEDDFDKNPSPETGHGPAKAVSGIQQKPCPENDESRVQNLDTNPVREPVREPVTRESASECEEEKNSSDQPEGLTKRAEALFFKSFKGWDRFDVSPKQPMLTAWKRLSWEQMEAAADAVPRFLAGKKAAGMRHAPAISTYLDLNERLWEAFPSVEEPEAQGPIHAPPFGPDWGAKRAALLLAGPTVTSPRLTRYEQIIVQRGEVREADLIREKLVKVGFPAVNDLDDRAADRRGCMVEPEYQALTGLVEAVPVVSPMFEAWRVEHERRGWKWVPDPGRQPVVFFPKGGPDGLDKFEAAIRGEAEKHDGGGREAAE